MTSISVNAGAGAGGSANLASGSTDARGAINVNTGTGVPTNANLATVTFGTPLSAVPVVTLTRADQNSDVTGLGNIAAINPTVNGFDIGFATSGGAGFSSISGLAWNYLVTP